MTTTANEITVYDLKRRIESGVPVPYLTRRGGEYVGRLIVGGIDRGELLIRPQAVWSDPESFNSNRIDYYTPTCSFRVGAGEYRCPVDFARCLDDAGVPREEAIEAAAVVEAACRKAMDLAEQQDRRVIADADHDSSGVWYVSRVYYAATGRACPRHADEGGTHARYEDARREAEERAERMRAQGYTVTWTR